MTSEPNIAYQYLSIHPDIFTEGDKSNRDFWPPVFNPKAGRMYPRVRHESLFSYDTTRDTSPAYLSDHVKITEFLLSTKSELKRMARELIHADINENDRSASVFDSWTEHEAADKCTEMQPILKEQFEEFIGNFVLNHTRLLATWVSKQVVSEAAHINKSAEKKRFGALIVSRQDGATVLAHHPWGPGTSLYPASQYTFKQQREKFMEMAPDIVGWLDDEAMDDEIFSELARDLDFGAAKISNESMVEFSWMRNHTGMTDGPN